MVMSSLLWTAIFFNILAAAAADSNLVFVVSTDYSTLIPRCAQGCVGKFIASSFPRSSCPNGQDLNCLCTSKSKTGFTLGEGAVSCIASNCPNEESFVYANAYQICSGVSNAQPMTHLTITASMDLSSTIVVQGNEVPATTTSTQSSRPSPTSKSFKSSPTSASSSNSTITSSMSLTKTSGFASPTAGSGVANSTLFEGGNGSLSTTISPSPTSSPNPAVAMATSAPTPISKPTLTGPQIAGVTVAGVTSAALSFGLILLCICLRRRRRQRQRQGQGRKSDSSFGGSQIFSQKPLQGNPVIVTEAHDDNRNISDASENTIVKPEPVELPARDYRDRWNSWSKPVNASQIGLAVVPQFTRSDITQEASPISVASYQTTSRLLPEKPTYSLFPSPDRSSAAGRSISRGSPLSDRQPPMTSYQPAAYAGITQPALRLDTNAVSSLSDPFITNSPFKSHTQSYDNSNRQAFSPAMHFPLPPRQQQLTGVPTRSPETTRPPAPTQPSYSPRTTSLSASEKIFHSGKPIFISAPSTSSTHHISSSAMSSNQSASTQTPRPRATISRRSSRGQRPQTTVSETSFEDEYEEFNEPAYRDTERAPGRSSQTAVAVNIRPAPPREPRHFQGSSPTQKPARKPPECCGGKHNNAHQPLRHGRDATATGSPGVYASAHQRTGSGPHGSNDAIKGSAKWKILCSPGLDGIETHPDEPWNWSRTPHHHHHQQQRYHPQLRASPPASPSISPSIPVAPPTTLGRPL